MTAWKAPHGRRSRVWLARRELPRTGPADRRAVAPGAVCTLRLPHPLRPPANAGKHHPHAIRILARAWLRVMWACWDTDTAYDPAHHRTEQRLAART